MPVREAIGVKVTFALSKEKPYDGGEVPAPTTVGAEREKAMTYFGAQPEPNTVFYLVAHGQRQPDERTVGQVAGDADEVEFGLRKEIVQGG
jgi:hypothetical protein